MAPDAPAEPRLTPAQRRAVEHPLAPLLVIAGAGTGKTHMLVQRIAYLISHRDAPAESILALTFTEKAAAELHQRIHRLSGADQTIAATTFHAFCYQVVLEFLPEYRPRRLMRDGDGLFLLREHFDELDSLQSQLFRRQPYQAMQAMQRFFDRLRDELIQPEQFPELIERTAADLSNRDSQEPAETEEVLAQLRDHSAVFARFQDWKAQEGLIDYSDMVYACWNLLNSDLEVQGEIQKRYSTVFIDEFQDNNYALNRVVELIVRPHQSITAVGDEDQSIYRFRGASAHNFPDFKRLYGGHRQYAEVLLTENFRSTQPILDLANAVMAGSPGRTPKNLAAQQSPPEAPLPRLLVGSLADQVALLSAEIAGQLQAGRAPGDVAVLVRTNSQAAKVVAGLTAADLPITYVSVPFFEIPAIRTARAWLGAVARSAIEPQALYRILAGDSGRVDSATYQAALSGAEAAGGSGGDRPATRELSARLKTLQDRQNGVNLPRIVRNILVESDLYRRHERRGFYSDRLAIDNLSLLMDLANTFSHRYRDAPLGRFVSYLDVMARAGKVETRIPPIQLPGGAIQVMTVHRAKGLEFPLVFMPFMQSGSFPLAHKPSALIATPPATWLPWEQDEIADEKEAHLEEERRLFYVGITRAREELVILCKPKGRAPFIRNLADNLMAEESPALDTREPDSTGENLRSDLQRRLARELGRKSYLKAHELVDAMRLVDEYEAGAGPDFSQHPLADELRQALAPGSPAAPASGGRGPLRLSATSLDTYEGCPLKYRYTYMDKIPRVEESAEATFGKIVHAALEQLHRPGGPGFDQSPEDLIEAAWETAGFAFSQQERQYRQDAQAALTTYIARWQDAPPPVLAVEHPFSFDIGSISLSGRIDRVDLDDEGRLQLVDYKTGKRRSNAEARRAPQLALYALYVQAAGAIAGQTITADIGEVDLTYYYIMSDQPELTIRFSAAELATFKGRIEDVARHIRSGDFPFHKDFGCNYCDYKDLICPAWERPNI